MALDIHLFLTTRKGNLPDLKTHQHVEDVRAWFSKVRNVAVKHNRFSEIKDEIINEAKPHPIIAGHSIVFYPPGELHEADRIGHDIGELFHGHRKKFDWHVAPNQHLQKGNYEVYLEIIVQKD